MGGNYSSWLEQKSNRLKQEEKAESKKQQTLEASFEWIHAAPRARQAKGKARLQTPTRSAARRGHEEDRDRQIFIARARGSATSSSKRAA